MTSKLVLAAIALATTAAPEPIKLDNLPANLAPLKFGKTAAFATGVAAKPALSAKVLLQHAKDAGSAPPAAVAFPCP